MKKAIILFGQFLATACAVYGIWGLGADNLVDSMRRTDVVGIIIRALAAVGVLMFAGIRVDARVDELESWYSYLEYVCEQKAICPELVQAIIETESNWDPEARNGDCVGLMQISEKWHQDRMERLGVTDLTDPYDNILVGVDYLQELTRRYVDQAMVLMIYNGDSRAWKFWETGEMSEYAGRSWRGPRSWRGRNCESIHA